MEDATDSSVESVTLMCASQILKTTVLENVIGFFMDVDPAPILLVQPTDLLAGSFSKERLAPMIRDTPALRDKVKEVRTRDSGNTILMKSFPGGNIALVGANAPAGLAGRPRRVVLEDEIDRYPASSGTEGDPCSLAERRTETFWNAVIYRAASPTVKGFSRIERAFEQTDKRRWFCPCPKCGHHQTLKWSQVKWTEPDGSDAIYECEGCHARLSDGERRRMIMAGEWRATAPFRGKRGYHLNGIASPWKAKKGFKSRLHQMAAGFLEAKAGGRETLKSWTNTFLAETWEEEVEQVEMGPLLERCENYPKGPKETGGTPVLPEQIILLIGGADVQKNRIEVEIVGVGLQEETWGVEYRVLEGDTEQDVVWQDLGELLGKKYQREDGVELSISATAIDTRHKPQKVRHFVQHSGIPRVYPVYGIGREQPILVSARFNKHYRLRTFAIATKNAKDTIFARLRIEEPGPRYMHFPIGNGYTKEFFEKLTAEVKKTEYFRGIPTEVYVKIRDRNEALDIRVYQLGALDILRPNLTAIAKRLIEARKTELPKDYVLKKVEEPVPAPAPKKIPFRPRRPGGGFVGGWKK